MSKGRWTNAADHEPHPMQVIDCTVIHAHGEVMLATLLMPSIEHAMAFTQRVDPGVHSPPMSLREAGKVIAMMGEHSTGEPSEPT